MSNYGFDERDTTAPTTRETTYQPQPQPQSPGYGYGQPGWGPPPAYGFGRGLRTRGLIETKPFFLTSEFVVSILAVVALAISAATMHAFGGWRAWILITAIVCSYNLSRGIAKSGTRSRAYDPREDVNLSFGRGTEQHERAHDRT